VKKRKKNIGLQAVIFKHPKSMQIGNGDVALQEKLID
jgi:hypothetical protein